MQEHLDIWLRLGAYIHQDFLEQYPDFGSGLEEFLSEEPDELKVELVSYLRNHLHKGTSAEDLWNSNGSMILLDNGGAQAVVDAIISYLLGQSDRITIQE